MQSIDKNVIGWNQWWLRGRVDPRECLAAFQPLGAEGIAQSLFNINGRGINDAAIATTPTHAEADGWTFASASSQYLTVGSGAIASAVPLSMVCLFQADNITSAYPLMSISRAASAHNAFTLEAGGATDSDPVRALSVTAGVTVAAVSAVGYVADQWYVAVGVWSAAAVRNAHIFSKDNRRTAYAHWGNWGTETTSSTPASVDTTTIGYTTDVSSPTYHGGKIGACAFYSIALNQKQVVEISLALLELV